MSRALRRLAMALGVLSACAPEPLPPPGHVLLFLDTDAPLGAGLGEVPVDGVPSALFDRAIVEVFEPGKTESCQGCRRELALDREVLAKGRASIQVPTKAEVPGYRVRARLFLGVHLASGPEPPSSGTIEVVAALPPAPNEGALERTLFFATDDVGVPRGSLAAPVDLLEGRPPQSKVGTWRGAVAVPCEEVARESEACVPGGAFWMGRPGERTSNELRRYDRPRLVVVGPTLLDRDEVSVAASREFMTVEGAIPWSGLLRGEDFKDFCTLTRTAGDNDRRPINCVTWPTARNYCLSQGKELPTEAEFEHAAGATSSRRFVWGEDPPRCDDAVYGRGGVGYLAGFVSPCRTGVFGPACVGAACSHGRDVFAVGDATIRDLAGNVSEWSLDVFDGQDDACWAGGGVRWDPLCTALDTLDRARTVRGGSWITEGSSLAAAARQGRSIRVPEADMGLRCARPGIARACGPVTPGLYSGRLAGDDIGFILTMGVGCNGIISVVGAHQAVNNARVIFILSGAVAADGEVRVAGRDVDAASAALRFVGRVVDSTHLEGTWTSSDGKGGTWRVTPKL